MFRKKFRTLSTSILGSRDLKAFRQMLIDDAASGSGFVGKAISAMVDQIPGDFPGLNQVVADAVITALFPRIEDKSHKCSVSTIETAAFQGDPDCPSSPSFSVARVWSVGSTALFFEPVVAGQKTGGSTLPTNPSTLMPTVFAMWNMISVSQTSVILRLSMLLAGVNGLDEWKRHTSAEITDELRLLALSLALIPNEAPETLDAFGLQALARAVPFSSIGTSTCSKVLGGADVMGPGVVESNAAAGTVVGIRLFQNPAPLATGLVLLSKEASEKEGRSVRVFHTWGDLLCQDVMSSFVRKDSAIPCPSASPFSSNSLFPRTRFLTQYPSQATVASLQPFTSISALMEALSDARTRGVPPGFPDADVASTFTTASGRTKRERPEGDIFQSCSSRFALEVTEDDEPRHEDVEAPGDVESDTEQSIEHEVLWAFCESLGTITKADFPMLLNQFLADHLNARLRSRFPDFDWKLTKFKKPSSFLTFLSWIPNTEAFDDFVEGRTPSINPPKPKKGLSPQQPGLVKTDETKPGVFRILELNKSHPLWRLHRTHAKEPAEPSLEEPTSSGLHDAYAGEDEDLNELGGPRVMSVEEVFEADARRIPEALSKLLLSDCEEHGPQTRSLGEVKQSVRTYARANNLIVTGRVDPTQSTPPDHRPGNVKPDAVLQDFCDGPTASIDDIVGRIVSRMSKWFLIRYGRQGSTSSSITVLKSGRTPLVTIESQQSHNHWVTIVRGLETWGFKDLELTASVWKKRFNATCTVSRFESEKTHKVELSLIVRANAVKVIAAFLTDQVGIPKAFIALRIAKGGK